MEQKRIYMDHAATTYVKPEVLDAMTPYFTEHFGNPSSIHSFARETKKAIDHAREQVANAIGATPSEIFFTSGATESDNWALRGMAYQHKNKGNHIINTAIEHHAILHTGQALEKQGFE
ncbi:MAG: aminotransferase class V-fold PLP-dependent enzyme, partial [Acutalibacteraceae bacterium]